jgi:hypothetical protein
MKKVDLVFTKYQIRKILIFFYLKLIFLSVKMLIY